jgi:hypothetical protein
MRCWERKAQQEATWHSPHRRNVAHGTRQAFPSHGIRGVLVPEKVGAFQKPIAGENLVEPLRTLENCGIIADPETDSGAANSYSTSEPLNPLQYGAFAFWLAIGGHVFFFLHRRR